MNLLVPFLVRGRKEKDDFLGLFNRGKVAEAAIILWSLGTPFGLLNGSRISFCTTLDSMLQYISSRAAPRLVAPALTGIASGTAPTTAKV